MDCTMTFGRSPKLKGGPFKWQEGNSQARGEPFGVELPAAPDCSRRRSYIPTTVLRIGNASKSDDNDVNKSNFFLTSYAVFRKESSFWPHDVNKTSIFLTS